MGQKLNLLTTTIKVNDASLIEEIAGPMAETSTSKYYYNNENAKKHIIVINYSGIENYKIEEAVKRLLKSIKRNK